MGSIKYIFTAAAPGADMVAHPSIEAIAGIGLVGDRYACEDNARTPECQITLIESEQIAAFTEASGHALGAHEPRRNLVTAGVSLNALCGQRFTVGPVVLEGIELCEPCATLARRTHPEIVRLLAHKGGLRTRIVKGGQLQVGDPVHTLTHGASD